MIEWVLLGQRWNPEGSDELKWGWRALQRQLPAQAKVVQLLVARNRVADAIKRIEGFLAQPLAESPGDLLRVTLGELRLKEYYALAPEARKAGTNLLGQVSGHAEFVLTNTPAPNPCSVGHTPTQA